MRAEGEPYVGFLYVSLMLTPAGPKVIEFNVRFGDPEAQVVLPQLEGSFAETLLAAATRAAAGCQSRVASDRCVGVVLASRGYPATPSPASRFTGSIGPALCPARWCFTRGRAIEAGRS